MSTVGSTPRPRTFAPLSLVLTEPSSMLTPLSGKVRTQQTQTRTSSSTLLLFQPAYTAALLNLGRTPIATHPKSLASKAFVFLSSPFVDPHPEPARWITLAQWSTPVIDHPFIRRLYGAIFYHDFDPAISFGYQRGQLTPPTRSVLHCHWPHATSPPPTPPDRPFFCCHPSLQVVLDYLYYCTSSPTQYQTDSVLRNRQTSVWQQKSNPPR